MSKMEQYLDEVETEYNDETSRSMMDRFGKMAFAGVVGFLATLAAESLYDYIQKRRGGEEAPIEQA